MTPRTILTITLITLPPLATLRYWLVCWLTPFTRCAACSGDGEYRTLILRRPRACPHCRGTGHRLRAGRRVYNHLRRKHNTASSGGAR